MRGSLRYDHYPVPGIGQEAPLKEVRLAYRERGQCAPRSERESTVSHALRAVQDAYALFDVVTRRTAARILSSTADRRQTPYRRTEARRKRPQ